MKGIENFSEYYDLYVAVQLPGGTDLVALENLNQFTRLNQLQKWLAPRNQNAPITPLDLILPPDLTTGEYCLYGILSLENEWVWRMAERERERWVMDQQCFEIRRVKTE